MYILVTEQGVGGRATEYNRYIVIFLTHKQQRPDKVLICGVQYTKMYVIQNNINSLEKKAVMQLIGYKLPLITTEEEDKKAKKKESGSVVCLLAIAKATLVSSSYCFGV